MQKWMGICISTSVIVTSGDKYSKGNKYSSAF